MSSDGIKISGLNQVNNVTNTDNFSVVLKKRNNLTQEKNTNKVQIDDKSIDNLISKESQESLVSIIKSKEILLTNSDINYINNFTSSEK